MIVEFSDVFIALIQSKYTCDGHPQVLNNKRYYLFTIEIEATPFYLCIPLHSNGKYFIPINTPPGNTRCWRAHGLNLEKILLLKSENFHDEVRMSSVTNDVWTDIQLKILTIITRSKEYIFLYLKCYHKQRDGQRLSSREINILKYSSLNHFSEYIDELDRNILETTNFRYGGL